jgi:tetratricopeptide (TPR) repeat protein
MRKRLSNRILSFALVAVAASVARPAIAHADGSKKSAKVYYDKGAYEYNLGHFEQAIAAFEKAYELSPVPILLFNIGQCHRQSGNKERAVFFYRRYLEQAPNADNRADVENRIADLEQSMKEERDIQKRPPTEVAGTPAAPAPAPEAPSTPPAAPLITPPEPTAPGTAPVQVSATRSEARHGSDDEGSWRLRRTLAWSATGAGAAALALGVVETVMWRSKVSDFDNHQGPSPTDPAQTIPNCGAGDPGHGGPGCQALYDSYKQAQTLAIVGYVAAGALGVGAAVLFLTSSPSEPRSGVVISCRPGFAGILCGGSF